MLGTTPRTLRQWESTGELIPIAENEGWNTLLRSQRPARSAR